MLRSSFSHTFSLVCSGVENHFVALAENAKSCGKKSRCGQRRALTPVLGSMGF